MFTTGVRLILGVCWLQALFACNESAGGEDRNSPDTGTLLSTHSNSPCDFVLVTPVSAEIPAPSKLDRSIIRSQKAVLKYGFQSNHLEALGWAFVQKARQARDPGYYTLAEQVTRCMEKWSPGKPDALLLLGHVMQNQHRFIQAETLARRLVAIRGLWFDRLLLGDIFLERGNLQEAARVYQEGIDQRPGPQGFARIARLRWLKGDVEGALEMLLATTRSTSARVPEAAAWAQVQLATLLMQMHNFPDSDKALNRALELNPDYPPALHLQGRLRLNQQRIKEAIPLLQHAVRHEPSIEFRWTLYEALRKAHFDDRAEVEKKAIYRFGVQDDPRTFSLFLSTHGENLQNALQLSLAELKSRQDVFTLDAISWALSKLGQYQMAFEYSQRALAEGTQDARLLFHAGVIATHLGKSQRSLNLLKAAYRLQHMLLPSEQRLLARVMETHTANQTAEIYREAAVLKALVLSVEPITGSG